MLTIEQAIEQYDGYANVCMCHNLTVSQKEFEQLVAWLHELRSTGNSRRLCSARIASGGRSRRTAHKADAGSSGYIRQVHGIAEMRKGKPNE